MRSQMVMKQTRNKINNVNKDMVMLLLLLIIR